MQEDRALCLVTLKFTLNHNSGPVDFGPLLKKIDRRNDPICLKVYLQCQLDVASVMGDEKRAGALAGSVRVTVADFVAIVVDPITGDGIRNQVCVVQDIENLHAKLEVSSFAK